MALPSMGAGGAGGGFTPSGNAPQQLHQLINRFGIRFDSNAGWGSNPQQGGGSHEAGSNHYANRAFDIGTAANSPQTISQMAAWARANAPRVREFFYDPLGWYIKNGKIVQGSIGGHGNHAHIAL
jgi:hypothetical protein